jgi:hypothetical protein
MKVYIISCYYEPDGTSWNIAAFSDKERAKIMCDRLNDDHDEDGYSYEIQSFMLDEEE